MPLSIKDSAKLAVSLATKKGAREAGATAYTSRQIDVRWRDGKVEKIHEATTRGLYLALYVDGRYASMSTSDLRREALDPFISNAVALTRVLEQDKYRALPDPSLYAGRSDTDLQIVDPKYTALTAIERKRVCAELEDAARNGNSKIVAVTTGVSDSSGESYQLHSNGFEGEHRSTSFNLSARTTLKEEDGRRPSQGDWVRSRFYAELPAASTVGKKATERTELRLGAKKGKSGVVTIVVENRAAGSILRHIGRALQARAIQQKSSFLEGKLGKKLFSDKFSVVDDPLIAKGLASRHFDDEGITAKAFDVINKGVLKNYYIDNYYGRKLGMTPTTARPSNIRWTLGTKDQAGLLADVGEGILVTGFLGGNSNATTGDFSLGIEGFVVRGGERAEPVAEMNISGNQLELWKRLVAVGNDPYPYSSGRPPTLVLEKVQVSGKS